MDESALNPVVQEALAVSRKISKYLTVDGNPLSYQEYRSLWETMATDRPLIASFLVCLITKGLILSYYELKPELTDSLLNMMTSKPLVAEVEKSRASSSVKNEMKRQMDLKVAVMNSVHYLLLHYPVDFNHFAVKKAYATWMDDLDKNKSGRDLFENELCNLMSSNEKIEGEQSIKDLVYRCANLSIKADLVENYNTAGIPTNRSLADSMFFSFLVGGIQRGPHRQLILSTATQLLTNWATISDLKYYSLIMMIREFLLKDQSLSGSTLTTIYEAVKPFYIWPAPFCDSAKDLLQYLDVRRRAPGFVNCLDFLRAHPDLLAKNKQDEFLHVIVNDESSYGQAVRDFLQDQPTFAQHDLKGRFLQVFSKAFFDGELEVWNFPSMDQIIVNTLFTKAVEIVLKVASHNGSVSKSGLNPKLKEFKQSVDDHVASLGGRVSKDPITSISDLDIGALPFTLATVDDKEFSFYDKGLVLPNGDEIPEVGGYQTLEKILTTYSTRTTMAKLKIMICGGDTTVSNFAWAYTTLRNTKPELFKLLDVSFYLLPTGSRNRLASCISLIDNWYGRQVLFSLKAAMWAIPSSSKLPYQEKRGRSDTLAPVSKDLFEKKDTNPPSGVPPSVYVRNLVDHYFRQANVALKVKVYIAEIWASSSGPTQTRRLIPFIQSVELGYTAFNALSARAENPSKLGKRASMNINKLTKFAPPEVGVKFTEIDVANVAHPGPNLPAKAYWAIQISNIPRAAEYDVVRPFSNCLELHLLDLENGRKMRGKPTPMEDGLVHYVNLVEIEDPSKRQFDLVVDGEPFTGVTKVRIFPANDPAQPPSADGVPKTCQFPIMTFIPPL